MDEMMVHLIIHKLSKGIFRDNFFTIFLANSRAIPAGLVGWLVDRLPGWCLVWLVRVALPMTGRRGHVRAMFGATQAKLRPHPAPPGTMTGTDHVGLR